MIYVPYLEITYRERQATDIIGSDVVEPYALAQVIFSTEYAMATDLFWQGARAFFYTLLGVMIFCIIVATYFLCEKPSLADGGSGSGGGVNIFFKMTMSTLDLFSTIYFWYLFAMTGYWFVFFKLQERVYCFMPGLDTHTLNYKPFDFLFGAVAICKLLYVFFKIIFEQCSYDIYLIDWETPRANKAQVPSMDGKSESEKTTTDVNAWRSLFLLNELNELQTYRIISGELTLIIYAVLMEGFGFKHWVTHDPDLNLSDTNSPANYTLFFFVTTLLMYTIATVQYVGRYILGSCFPLETTQICDLASMCNLSILIFNETFHGYYIHGRAPCGQAEISSEALRHALDYEASGKGQVRGLSTDDPDL
mgnify:CR=1 FL=1